MESKVLTKRIPFVDLQAQHKPLMEEIDKAVRSVIGTTGFILGPETGNFEKEFAEYFGAKHCVGLGSGTDALYLSLLALEIGKGDEVIVPALTFAASALAITYTGATPVFVDVDEKTYNIDPAKIEKAITPKTKALMPVHLYGQPAAMDKILAIAKTHKLFVVEDACQAHGATFQDKKAGTFGDVACFSFYPSKNLGACGDGGALITASDKIDAKIRMLRNYGQPVRYVHKELGFNSRLDSLQAAILRIKLRHLDQWNAGRRQAAAHYNELLKGAPVTLPYEAPDAKSVYHLYVVRAARREELRQALGEAGIDTGIHYDTPLHLQECFRYLGYKDGDFPVAEKAAREIVSLPMFPELSKEDVELVARTLKRFYKA